MDEFKKLLHFGRPYRKQAIFSITMLIATVFLDLSIPRFMQTLIDDGVKPQNMSVVLRTSAIMLGLSISSMITAVFNNNYSIKVGEGVGRDLRQAIFEKIQNFSYANADQFSTGKLMVRLTSDSSAVQRLFQVSLRIGSRAPLEMILSVVLMFVTSPNLAWSMIPVLFVSWTLIVLFSVKMEPLFRTVQQKLDRLNTVLQENLAGARLVKSFVRADHETERFDVANGDFTDGTIKVTEVMSSMSPLLTLMVNIGMVLVVWLGGIQAIGGGISTGQILAFVSYLLATMHPLVSMTNLSNTWANGLASAKRINEVLEAEPDIIPPLAPKALPPGMSASVDFKDVDFHYSVNSDLAVLENIRLNAEPGEMVAILGATGAGKSTLVNLIPRFYDASSGSVRIDDFDVRDLEEDSLLEHISVVPQETILFSGTVRDNIRYGCPDASQEEVERAAKIAQAHDFIMRLPQGYDTPIEERGANLSGGQKQRVSIARAIITHPAILILDDSTSAVDVETETRIQTALADELKGCTVFVVAQRISTVLNADRIIVLDEGRIVAEGKHLKLLKTSPIYKEIYDSQLGGAPQNA
ncbi:MAG TPA: ABC transporter ATP-binding protein [Spirochaetales bacterium]|nr:ABC transporter ATP-binding protein [Spirochaetales bacterium]